MKLPILIAMVLYMAMVIWIGVIYSKKTKTSEDYFLGGRGLGPWVTAMSAEASDMSSWLLMGLPGLAYATGFSQGRMDSNRIDPWYILKLEDRGKEITSLYRSSR